MIDLKAEPAPAGWSDIPKRGLDDWNKILLGTDASLFQYPFWNEPFRRMHFSPRYLVYHSQGRFVAYVCILTIGVPGLRIGLVQRGPVGLAQDSSVPLPALQSLYRWAKRRGYIFLRFTHTNPEFLKEIASVGPSERSDAFPFYQDSSHELVVEQVEDDSQMLAAFQQIARQEIKKADQVGYELRVSDSAEAFTDVWHLFEGLSARKGFRFRPLQSYLDLIRLARPHHCVRLYVAYHGGEPVEAVFILRDRSTAYYISGALDTKVLRGRVSPSCFIHWHAMRELFGLGVKHYHLGTRSGAVYQFKRKFRPTEIINPLPLTLVVNKALYNFWRATVLRLGPAIWPRVKRIIFL